jgi:hypothetical protein
MGLTRLSERANFRDLTNTSESKVEDEDNDEVAAVVGVGSQVLEVLEAETVTVALQNGNIVEGSFVSFTLRRRARKGEQSLSGKLSVETDSGVLEMDCSNIASVKPKN